MLYKFSFKYILVLTLYLNWYLRQSGTRAQQQIAYYTLATQNNDQGKSWARYLKYAKAHHQIIVKSKPISKLYS